MFTLHSSIELKGIGIHSGQMSSLRVSPGQPQSGIRFCISSDPQNLVSLSPDCLGDSHNRCTSLQFGSTSVLTPEHFFAALQGLRVTDIEVSLEGPEFPILDGSAKAFAEALRSGGLTPLSASNSFLEIKSPLCVADGDAFIEVHPSDVPSFTYELDYGDRFPGAQAFSYVADGDLDTFMTEIAPARTYGFEAEVRHLLDSGLAKGGSLDNALVIGETDYLNPPRFENECARHKCLDLMGDMMILGKSIKAAIRGHLSGHALNATCVKAIQKALES